MKIAATLLLLWSILSFSCTFHKTASNSLDPNKTYKLRLNPVSNSQYHYDIATEQSIDENVEDKEIKNEKNTDVGMDYRIIKDSSGNLLIGMTYDKIKLHSRDGEAVSDIDAANAANSFDPTERLLGRLKAATITATVSPDGVVRSVKGYQEVIDGMLAGMNFSLSDKAKAQAMWQQLVEQGLVRKNMDQMFKLFPDSTVHVGDKWKLFSTETNQLTFTVRNFYTLKSIEDNVATIESEGDVTSDSAQTNVMGVPVIGDLKGKQVGVYAIDVRTGMLISSKVGLEIEGTMQVQGKEVRVKIRSKTNMEGQKRLLPSMK